MCYMIELFFTHLHVRAVICTHTYVAQLSLSKKPTNEIAQQTTTLLFVRNTMLTTAAAGSLIISIAI